MHNVPFAKWAVFSPNAAAASRTSAIAISSSGVISSLADEDKDDNEWRGFARIIPVMGGAPCVTNATAEEEMEMKKETKDLMMMDFISFSRWISVLMKIDLIVMPDALLLALVFVVADTKKSSTRKQKKSDLSLYLEIRRYRGTSA